MRLETNSSWAIYAVKLVVRFYSHFFLGIVAIAEGTYVVIVEKIRFYNNVIGYLLESIAGYIAQYPGIITIIKNSGNGSDKTSWLSLIIPVS